MYLLCIYGQLCYIFTVIYSCSIVAFYMYDFYTIILYGIMLNLCQSWLLKLDIACHCSLFGSFGKYRNRTESTDTEFPRYRVSAGPDRYRLTEEPNLYGYTECPGCSSAASLYLVACIGHLARLWQRRKGPLAWLI